MAPVARSLEERFWQFVAPMTEGRGCWEWTGGLHEFGYGKLWDNDAQENVGAHRVSFKLHKGDIPPGFEALHSCDNASCVNPSHLFAGTQGDNVRDCVAKGRHRNGDRTLAASITRARHAAKTHCKRGHVIDGATTLKSGRMMRFCTTCAAAQKRAYKERNA